ncbi:hypothetical protein AOV_05100 [Anaplasma ovis str. Haibei]|uniref:Uncharacterized protein n=1 Tax=Anaplasma ovis str. Haibei TaxID=1248439 RepID=A0A2Z4VDV3_9RICK|nr:hypothetical protein AOV_05100 [Anaplasma ovis str. Haibei]
MQQHPGKVCKNPRVFTIITTEDMSDLLAKTHGATKTARSSNTCHNGSAPNCVIHHYTTGMLNFKLNLGIPDVPCVFGICQNRLIPVIRLVPNLLPGCATMRKTADTWLESAGGTETPAPIPASATGSLCKT